MFLSHHWSSGAQQLIVFIPHCYLRARLHVEGAQPRVEVSAWERLMSSSCHQISSQLRLGNGGVGYVFSDSTRADEPTTAVDEVVGQYWILLCFPPHVSAWDLNSFLNMCWIYFLSSVPCMISLGVHIWIAKSWSDTNGNAAIHVCQILVVLGLSMVLKWIHDKLSSTLLNGIRKSKIVIIWYGHWRFPTLIYVSEIGSWAISYRW